MINMRVKCYFVHDNLQGEQPASESEIKIELLEILTDRFEDDSD